MASLHIIPPIVMQLDGEEYSLEPIDFVGGVPENVDVVFLKLAEPDFIKEMKKNVLDKLSEQGVRTKEARARDFVVTLGPPEEITLLVLTMGVLPVVLGILSNYIWDLINKRGQSRNNITLKVRVKEKELEISASGPLPEVVKILDNFRKQIFESSSMSGNSHIANVIGDGMIVDFTEDQVDARMRYYQEKYGMDYRLRLGDDVKSGPAVIHLNIGVVYAKLGQEDKAIKKFEEAIKLDDWCVEAHYNLSLLYAKHNNIKEALEHFEKALVLLSTLPRLGDQPPDANASCLIGKLFHWKT